MKTQLSHARRGKKSRQGSAVIVILAMLGIMVLLMAANTVTVNSLRKEIKLLDQRQTARLAASATNQLADASRANQPVALP
jgi:hypothetical protein